MLIGDFKEMLLAVIIVHHCNFAVVDPKLLIFFKYPVLVFKVLWLSLKPG